MTEPVAYPYALSVDEALLQLGTSPRGLSAREATHRLSTFGPNRIESSERSPVLRLVVKQFKSWLVGILLIAAVISWLTGQMVDAWVIAINAGIGFVQEYRAGKALEALRKQAVKAAKVVREGEVRVVPIDTLVPGDVIVLDDGDYIPADARLIEAKNLRSVEASLTGESLPVSKHSNPLPRDTPLADRKNMVWKGTFVAGGYARALVVATGLQTALGDVSSLLVNIRSERSHFLRKTDTLARQMALIAFGTSLLIFIVGYFIRGFALSETLLIFIAALVAAVPEGLAAVISIVLAIGAHRMARNNALVREFTATETLGAVTAILTDKTGTLTQNSLVVRKVFLPGEAEFSVTGEGWFPAGNFVRHGQVIEPAGWPLLQKLLLVSALSNNSEIQHRAETDAYELIGDPTEGALNVLARKGGFSRQQVPCEILDDLPFDSQLKLRATLVQTGRQRELLVVGAPERLLEKSSFISTSGGVTKLTPEALAGVQEKISEWSGEAHRVIGLAYRSQEGDTIEEAGIGGLVFAGLAGMVDPPRKDVKEAVKMCRRAGIRVIMVTGDHVNTAIAIARATGILEEANHGTTAALTEQQLARLDEEEFDKAVGTTSVFARLSPQMKLRIAERLQAQGHLIAMTGDGVNDAPALKRADVGVSMGVAGTDVARYASDLVLTDDNFATIVKAVEQGRIVFQNARQTSFFLVTTNIAESATLVLAILMGFPMPLTATQILWLNLVTDGVTDMALATEQGHGDRMNAPPLNPHENILNKTILPFLLINVFTMTLLSIAAFVYYEDEGIEMARTGVFIVLSFTQLFNVYNLRSLELSLFAIKPFSNRYINLAVGASVALLVILTEWPVLSNIFRFTPLNLLDFLLWFALSSSVLWFGEAYKFLRRARTGTPAGS